MANCSKCYRYIKNSNKQYYADGENQKVLLCDKCYHEGRAEQIKSNTTVGSQNVEVSGITNHNKVMTPEEIKKHETSELTMYITVPGNPEPVTSKVIGHRPNALYMTSEKMLGIFKELCESAGLSTENCKMRVE